MVIPEEINGVKVIAVAKEAFSNCTKLESIVLPDTVTSIGDSAFRNCSALEEIEIPESVTGIDVAAFYGCSALTEVKLPAQLTTISKEMFRDCLKLENVEIGDSVKFIKEKAFFGCSSLQKFASSEKLTTISKQAFKGCTSLKKVYLSDKLTSVEENAFENCTNLTVYYKSDKAAFKKIDIESGNDAITKVSIIENHAHKKDSGVVKVEATCTENGYEEYFCNCGKHFVEGYVTALGHDLIVPEIVKAPTCTKAGKVNNHCVRCDYYETVSVSKKGHTEVTDKEVKADCYNPGKTKGSHCSVCETVITAQKTVAALGHSYTKKVKDKAHLASKATYVKKAKYYYSCSRCVAISPDKTFEGDRLSLGTTLEIDTKSDNKSITLTWKKVKDATGYYVYLKNADGKYERKKRVKTTKAVIDGLSQGKTYTFAVKAYVIEGERLIASNDKTEINAATLPGAPSKITASRGQNSIKLTWSASKGATGYRLYAYNHKTKKWSVLKSNIEGCTYTVKKLKSGTYYTYGVKAYTTIKKVTVFSKNATTVQTCTNPESPVVKTTSLKNSVRLNWSKVSGADGYVIYGSSNANSGYKKLAVTSSLTFTKSKLTSRKTYYFRVVAFKKLSGGSYALGKACTVKAKTK